MVVAQLATTGNLLFGGTASFLVAREFSDLATYDQKLALMRCLFALSATDEAISTAEEGEIHRSAKELHVDQSRSRRIAPRASAAPPGHVARVTAYRDPA